MGAAAAAPNLWLFEVTAAASAVIAVYGPRMSVRIGLPGQDGRTQGALPPSNTSPAGIKVHCNAHEIVNTPPHTLTAPYLSVCARSPSSSCGSSRSEGETNRAVMILMGQKHFSRSPRLTPKLPDIIRLPDAYPAKDKGLLGVKAARDWIIINF